MTHLYAGVLLLAFVVVFYIGYKFGYSKGEKEIE